MQSNFEFFKTNPLTADYFPSATQVEKSYALGLYSGEETSIRVVAENIERDIADQQFLNVTNTDTFNDALRVLKYDTNIDHDTLELFYDLKQSGNQTAHQLAVMTVSKIDQETELRDLKRLYKLLFWFVNTFYDQTISENDFHEPQKEDYIYTATITPSAAERNLIYIQSAKTENGHFIDYIGSEKIGKASVTDLEADMGENSGIWTELLETLIKQGVKDVLLFVADGLVGLDEGLNRHFPKAKRQRCLVHVGRNLMNKVRVKDRKAVISDFKQVHRAANREAAELKLNEFANNWHQTYPKLIKDLLKMPNLLTFMDFPPAIRQSLYSTNLIENFNKHLKRTTHHKEQFPTEDSLDRFLVSQFNVYNEKSLKRIHRGFKGLQDTLEASFI